MLDWRLVSD